MPIGAAGESRVVKSTFMQVDGVPAEFVEFPEQQVVGRVQHRAKNVEAGKPFVSLNEGFKGFSRFLPSALAALWSK